MGNSSFNFEEKHLNKSCLCSNGATEAPGQCFSQQQSIAPGDYFSLIKRQGLRGKIGVWVKSKLLPHCELWTPVLWLGAPSAWCAEVSQCWILVWETTLTVIVWKMHVTHWKSEYSLGWKRWHSPVFLSSWAWKTVWWLLAEEYTAGPVARISDCETPITHRGHWQQRQVAKCLHTVSWSPVFSFPLQEECE